MEAEVVKISANLFHGGPNSCGTVIIKILQIMFMFYVIRNKFFVIYYIR